MATSLEKTKELTKQLTKATSESHVEDIYSLLKQLKEVVEPTEELIRVCSRMWPLTQATKIGVAVGKLRTHSDARVSELAKDLVKTWKGLVEKQRRDTSVKEKAAKTNADDPAPAPAPAPESKSTAPINIDFEVLQDKTRNACLKLLYGSLEQHPGAEKQTVYACAMQIEAATYNKIGASTVNGDYRAKVRSLSLNLKDKNNPELREQVLQGVITADRLVEMRSEEMASSARKADYETIRQQNLHNAKGAESQEAETDAFQCGKCKQRKTRYYQMQTRSADEPMTTFVTCVNCAHKWKFC